MNCAKDYARKWYFVEQKCPEDQQSSKKSIKEKVILYEQDKLCTRFHVVNGILCDKNV